MWRRLSRDCTVERREGVAAIARAVRHTSIKIWEKQAKRMLDLDLMIL